jgi:hypothetical protein
VTPEEAAREQAAKTEAFRQLTASLRYIMHRYGHMTQLSRQAAAHMQQVARAWQAAGGNASPAAGGSGSGSGGEYAPERSPGGSDGGSYASGGLVQYHHGGNGSTSSGSGGGGAGSNWSPDASAGSGVAWGAGGGGGGGGGSYAPGGPVVPAGGGGGGGGSGGGGGGGGGSGSGSGGGLVVTPGRSFTPGVDGFSDELPVVAGSVTGYRWWTIPAPDLDGSPAHADDEWDPGREARLRGAWADWQPEVNHAVCLANPNGPPPHDPGLLPALSCGCGYWAYWGAQRHELGRQGCLPVFGVIKAWGRTRVGPHGFRAAKARILAVHLPLTIGNLEHMAAEAEARAIAAEARAHYRGRYLPPFTGRVVNIGTDHVPWPLRNDEQLRYGKPAPAPPTPEEIAAEKVKAEAWMAVIGDRIGQLYPGAEVCETRDHLLAKYPPDKVYGNRR